MYNPSEYLNKLSDELSKLYPESFNSKIATVTGKPIKKEGITMIANIIRRAPHNNRYRPSDNRTDIDLPKYRYNLDVDVVLHIYILGEFTEASIQDVLGRIEYYVAHEQGAGKPIVVPTLLYNGADVQNRSVEYILSWGQRIHQEEYHEPPQLIRISSVHTEVTGSDIDSHTINVPRNA